MLAVMPIVGENSRQRRIKTLTAKCADDRRLGMRAFRKHKEEQDIMAEHAIEDFRNSDGYWDNGLDLNY